MWPRILAKQLGIAYPIVQAPMAGGSTRPELVVAVSEAGALGSLAGGALAPEALATAIREVRRLTRRPFAVNLFVPDAAPPPSEAEVAAAVAALDPIRRELGLGARPGPAPPPDFAGQLAVAREEKVGVLSFTFGELPPAEVRALQAAGTRVIGTATTAEEARRLEATGVDAVVAQGSEAGGHRGTFAGPPERALVGTMALVPQIVDAVRIPVVAAGGIMDGRGIVAAFALGASAVQMGTAFLACAESGAHPLHKEAVLRRRGEDATTLTRSFTGRLARGFANRFMVEIERAGAILPYPHQNQLTQDLRQAAAQQERPEFLSLWAGQGAPLAVEKGARELVEDLVAEAERVARSLR